MYCAVLKDSTLTTKFYIFIRTYSLIEGSIIWVRICKQSGTHYFQLQHPRHCILAQQIELLCFLPTLLKLTLGKRFRIIASVTGAPVFVKMSTAHASSPQA